MKKILVILMFFVLVFSGCKPKKELTFTAASVLSSGLVHIEGEARAFENTIGVKITDDKGFTLYAGPVITDAKDMSKFGKFSEDLALNIFPQSDEITVECFIASPKDGSITSSETKKLTYNIPYRIVKVFFGNVKLNPEMLDCTKVFPVERRVAKNDTNPEITTMKFLLLGATSAEKDEGYSSITPSNLTINYIKTQGKNVQIDFGIEMMQAGGGSCRVGAIRSEITETLQQFYPGYNVIISSEGNIEEVLQP